MSACVIFLSKTTSHIGVSINLSNLLDPRHSPMVTSPESLNAAEDENLKRIEQDAAVINAITDMVIKAKRPLPQIPTKEETISSPMVDLGKTGENEEESEEGLRE